MEGRSSGHLPLRERWGPASSAAAWINPAPSQTQPLENIEARPKTSLPFSPTQQPCVKFAAVSPAGTPVATVIAWGGTGASGRGLTWSVARGGSVRGFPCGYYGPCVLDEHIGREPCSPGLSAKGFSAETAGLQGFRRSGTDGDRNRRRVARSRRLKNISEGSASRPASRTPPMGRALRQRPDGENRAWR